MTVQRGRCIVVVVCAQCRRDRSELGKVYETNVGAMLISPNRVPDASRYVARDKARAGATVDYPAGEHRVVLEADADDDTPITTLRCRRCGTRPTTFGVMRARIADARASLRRAVLAL